MEQARGAATFAPETVGEVMSRPLLTIDAGASLDDARRELTARGVHHLLVEDGGRVVGILSDRDVLRHASPWVGTFAEQTRDARTLQRRVFQIASFEVVTVRADASIYEATALRLERGISALPVVDAEHAFVGIVTTRDLLRGLLACSLPHAEAVRPPPRVRWDG